MSIADFDGNKRIMSLHVGVTSFTVSLLYSDWKRWTALDDNAKFLPAFRYVGGDPTIPGQFLGSTYFIMNSWKIRPFNGDHTLIVDGNLFTEDQSSPFLPAIDPHMVAVQMAYSNLTTTIIADSTGTIITPENIATAVWDKPIDSAEISQFGTIGRFVKDMPKNAASSVWTSPVSGSDFNTSGTASDLVKNIEGNVITSVVTETANLGSSIASGFTNVNTTLSAIPGAIKYEVWTVPSSELTSGVGLLLKDMEPNILQKIIDTNNALSTHLETLITNVPNDVWCVPTSGSDFGRKGTIAEFIKNQILTVGKYIGLS